MKQFIALMLAIVFLLSLSACHSSQSSDSNSVIFYYMQSDYTHSPNLSVVAAEEREFSGGHDNLPYLLTLYMLGPLDEYLSFPFPQNTQIKEINTEGNDVTISLSDLDSSLSDSEFSIASACLSMTVFGLTDCENVIISSGQRSISMNRYNTLFHDDVANAGNTTEASQ